MCELKSLTIFEVFCSCLVVTIFVTGVESQCLFPDYIQSPIDEFGEPMAWHTKVWWLNLRNEPKLREMHEVFVLRSHIWSQRQNNRWSCDRNAKRRVNHRATSGMFGSCTEKYLLYNRTCLTEDRPNRFRVIQYGARREPKFLCIRFIKRSDNVIQVMEGPIKDINDQDLCDDRKLHMDEWPWIAPWRKQVISCPISGGFSFRTLNKLTNEDFCEEEWRKSRLEIDCAKGDGLNFIAPRGSECNPFSKEEESRLYCWAGWDEKFYTFLVVGNDQGVPQFCLRFPNKLTQQFSVMVYFSVLCPIQDDGMPPTGIEYHELKMNSLEPDACIDDDAEKCNLIMKRGQCKKEEKYGLHCERTCNKCLDRGNMINMMCPFSTTVQGTWLFMDKFHKETVKINTTALHFKDFGMFICKERSVFSEKLYKTVTLFDNGCAMRYTCFELQRRNNNILQFRAGDSSRSDAGFDTLCKFKDEALPVSETYRSSQAKNLILDGYLRDEFCGFSSIIPFNGTIYGESCTGSITDWDSDGCVTRGVLKVKSDTCSNLVNPLEYQCLGFLSDHPLEQFLITKSLISGNYNCWVLTSFLCDHWDWKFRALVKLDNVQCITLADSACALDSTPEVLLYLEDDDKSKYCKGFVGTKYRNDITTRSTTYYPPSYDDGDDNLLYHVPNPDRSSATVYQMDPRENSERVNSRSSISSLANSIESVNYIFISLTNVVTLFYLKYGSPT